MIGHQRNAIRCRPVAYLKHLDAILRYGRKQNDAGGQMTDDTGQGNGLLQGRFAPQQQAGGSGAKRQQDRIDEEIAHAPASCRAEVVSAARGFSGSLSAICRVSIVPRVS